MKASIFRCKPYSLLWFQSGGSPFVDVAPRGLKTEYQLFKSKLVKCISNIWYNFSHRSSFGNIRNKKYKHPKTIPSTTSTASLKQKSACAGHGLDHRFLFLSLCVCDHPFFASSTARMELLTSVPMDDDPSSENSEQLGTTSAHSN